jgi:hypothetical protein
MRFDVTALSNHQNHVFRVRLSSDEISPVFLSWLVDSRRGKSYFLRSAKQTTGIASTTPKSPAGFCPARRGFGQASGESSCRSGRTRCPLRLTPASRFPRRAVRRAHYFLPIARTLSRPHTNAGYHMEPLRLSEGPFLAVRRRGKYQAAVDICRQGASMRRSLMPVDGASQALCK